MTNHLRAFVVVALCACATTAPRRAVPPGTFVLTSFNGRGPTVTTDTSATEYGQLIADTLIFEDATHVLRATVFRRVSTVFGFDETYRPRVELEYRLRGDQIEIGSFAPCPDLCVPNDVGTFDGTSIAVTTYRYGNSPQVVFSRVDRLE